MATAAQLQAMRDYAASQGFNPDANGSYTVTDENAKLKIYGHAQAQGYSAADMDAAFGWNPGDAQTFIDSKGLPPLGTAKTGSTSTSQQIRDYATSQGFLPDASGKYPVASDTDALTIYGHAQAMGYTPAQLDAAFGWNPGDAQNFITAQGLPNITAPATGGTTSTQTGSTQTGTGGSTGGGASTGGIVNTAVNETAGGAQTFAPQGFSEKYAGVLNNFQQPTDYPDWATDDYLRSVWDAGYEMTPQGGFKQRMGLADGADKAAQQVDAFLRGEYEKAVASGSQAAIDAFDAKYKEAKKVFNDNYVVNLAQKNFKPLSASERSAAAKSAYDSLSKFDGISVGGYDPSKFASFEQMTGVDDGTKMDFEQAMANARPQAPAARQVQRVETLPGTGVNGIPPQPGFSQGPTQAAPPTFDISGGGYDAFKKAVDDYKMHGGLLTDQPGLDMSKYNALLSQADAAKKTDVGSVLMNGGMQGSEKGKGVGLVANAMSDYFAGNIHKVADKMKPMEYAGPVAGKSTAPGAISAGTGQVEPPAPLQTPVLARKTGIIGARM